MELEAAESVGEVVGDALAILLIPCPLQNIKVGAHTTVTLVEEAMEAVVAEWVELDTRVVVEGAVEALLAGEMDIATFPLLFLLLLPLLTMAAVVAPRLVALMFLGVVTQGQVVVH